MKKQNGEKNTTDDGGFISLILMIIIGLLIMKYAYHIDPLQYFAPAVAVIQKTIVLTQEGLTLTSKILGGN